MSTCVPDMHPFVLQSTFAVGVDDVVSDF